MVNSSCVIRCQDLRLQEQPPFMVVPSYDDSLVFEFHKPPHHSHVLLDPGFPVPCCSFDLCNHLSSIRAPSHQAFPVADVMRVHPLDFTRSGWLFGPTPQISPASVEQRHRSAERHNPLCIALAAFLASTSAAKPQGRALRP